MERWNKFDQHIFTLGCHTNKPVLKMSITGGASSSRSSKTTNLEQIWDDLKEGIQQIYLKQDMARPRYMQLYTYLFLLFNGPSLHFFFIFILLLKNFETAMLMFGKMQVIFYFLSTIYFYKFPWFYLNTNNLQTCVQLLYKCSKPKSKSKNSKEEIS